MVGLATYQAASAQSPLIRPDSIEMKRIGAMATVQRLARPARSTFDPAVVYSGAGADPRARPGSSGSEGCTFNIGDVASAKAADGLAQPAPHKGLDRTEYITLVEGTPICVQR